MELIGAAAAVFSALLSVGAASLVVAGEVELAIYLQGVAIYVYLLSKDQDE